MKLKAFNHNSVQPALYNRIPILQTLLACAILLGGTHVVAQPVDSSPESNPREAETDAWEPNTGLPFPILGLCLYSPYCATDNGTFKLAQLNVVSGNSNDFVGAQIGGANYTYGPALVQAGLYNQSKMDSKISGFQLGLINRSGDKYGTFYDFDVRHIQARTAEEKPYPISIVQLAALGNTGSPRIIGLQLAGISNRADQFIGYQVSLFSNYARDGYGVQLGPIFNSVQEDMFGVQGGMGLSATNLYGLQFGLMGQTNNGYGAQMSISGMSDSLTGVQMNAIMSVNSVQIRGAQLATIFNYAQKDLFGLQLGIANNVGQNLYGAQIGALNMSHSTHGVQVGGINFSDEAAITQLAAYNHAGNGVTGFQFGLVNIADGKARMQIGIINYAAENSIPFLPLVNMDFGPASDSPQPDQE
ncbi:MAG: hypothetical protein KDK27_11335 [Leptospiraceae bacterium]|nr:hypothetical protein [Leptospiraceae bacterium]